MPENDLRLACQARLDHDNYSEAQGQRLIGDPSV